MRSTTQGAQTKKPPKMNWGLLWADMNAAAPPGCGGRAGDLPFPHVVAGRMQPQRNRRTGPHDTRGGRVCVKARAGCVPSRQHGGRRDSLLRRRPPLTMPPHAQAGMRQPDGHSTCTKPRQCEDPPQKCTAGRPFVNNFESPLLFSNASVSFGFERLLFCFCVLLDLLPKLKTTLKGWGGCSYCSRCSVATRC